MARRRTAPFAGPKLHRLEDRLTPAITADLPTWLPAGPAPISGGFSQVPASTDGTSPANATSGSLVAASPDPLDANILFVASPNGGIWRTVTATAASPSWTNLTDRLPSQSISAMDLDVAPAPGNRFRRLFAGTGAVTDAGAVGDRTGLLYVQDALALDGKGNLGQPLIQSFPGDTTATFSAPFQTTSGGIPVTVNVPVTVGYPNGQFVGANTWSVATRSYTPGANPRAVTGTAYLLAATDRGLFIADRLADGTVTAFRPLNGSGGLPAPTVQLAATNPFAVYRFANAINPRGITDLTVDPQDPKRVYASGQFGVFRTNDITAATVVWIDLTAQLTAFAGLPATTPLISATTDRVKVAVHGGLTGPNDPNVVYVAVANPAPVGTSDVVTVLWSTDQAALVNGRPQGSPFAGTFTLMDEPVQLSVELPRITDASNAKPIVLATTAGDPNITTPPLANGDRVLVENVGGNGGANGVFTVSGVSATAVTLDNSAATGKYQANSGVLRQVLGLLPDGRADLHFSLAADPTNPNLVYIGGTYYNRPTFTGGRSPLDTSTGQYVGSSAVLFRGDRSRPFLGGLVSERLLREDTTFQWTPLTDNKAAYPSDASKTAKLVGTSPASDTRFMAFDANNNLIEVDDGGVYRRTRPQQNGRTDLTNPFEPPTAAGNIWASVNGNLQVAEYNSVGFDPNARAVFGSTANTGHARQTVAGSNLPPAAGGTVQVQDDGNTATLGNTGNVFQFVVATDTLSIPGRTVRYYADRTRQVFDQNNNQVFESDPFLNFLNLGSPTDNKYQAGIVAADKTTGLIVAPNSTRPQVFGTPVPGVAGTLLIGGNGLYEDNDPTDQPGVVVGDITPAGYSGQATSIVYGGRQPGAGGDFVLTPRVAYVGTNSGQLWVRRSVGGFVNVAAALDALSLDPVTGAATPPQNPSVLSVVVDPDDWRIAYVLRTGFETRSFTTPTGGTGTTTVRRDRVLRTINGGVTFEDVTGGLVANGSIDTAGNQVGLLDAQGNPANGLTTRLFTLALYDGDPTAPGYVNGQRTDQDVLLAGGRGGVYRLTALPDGNGGRLPERWTEFGTGLPNVTVRSLSLGEYQYLTPGGNSLRGVGLAAGTVGRGTYVIPDIAAIAPSTAGTPNPVPLALASATVVLTGVRADGAVGPLAGSVVADVNNPAFVTVSDGTGAVATFERSTIQGFSFKGTAANVDRVDLVAGSQAGGDLNFVRFPISVDLGNTKGDFVGVSNGNKASATVVTIGTVTVNPPVSGGLRPVIETIGAGPTDNLFSTAAGGSLRLAGLDQGTVVLDLGTGSSVANSVFVQGTKAGVTRVIGGVGADPVVPTRGDIILVNSNAGFIQVPIIDPRTGRQATDPVTGAPQFNTVPGNITGTLDNLLGSLEVFGPVAAAGKYKLQLSDQGSTGGNNGVVLGRDAASGLGTVVNLGGPTGTSAIRYNGAVGDLTVRGSDAAISNQSYTVADPLAPLTLYTGDGPATLNVQVLTRPASLATGPANDLIQVGSRAGVNNDGDLSRITVPLNLEAGAGDNRLVVSNAGSPVSTTVTVTRNSISGASAGAISYAATGGRFVDPLGGAGVLYQGSNLASDVITLGSALKNSQTTIDGRGGPDSITVLGDDLQQADVVIRGGGGGDTVTVTQGVFGVNANSFQVVGTGPDTLVVQGYDQKFRTDSAALRVDGGGRGSVFVDGGVTDVRFSGVKNVTFDGLAGRNNLNVVDNTGTVLGSPTNLAAGIVVAPLGPDSGTVRLGTLDPVISFKNVTGSDTDGLVITGDPSGTGKFADTVTVVGPSETGLGGTGNLAGLTAPTANSTLTVSDGGVVFETSAVGPVRSVALGRVNGRPTVSNLVVLAGNQSKQGDKVTVVPSRDTNILVDGQGPSRSGTAGNVLTVGTSDPFTLSSTTSPALGGPQTRVTTGTGASFGYRNFGRLVGGPGGGRSIYAVGADVGGGPRVRVYDALTQDVLFDQFVYEPTFTGGVRVATGDVTGDGVPDLIVAAGPTGGPRVSVYDGVSFKVVSSFFAYETTFTGGLYLAVGDLDGDGSGEIVTGTGVGGGPLVKAFDSTGKLLTSVFAFESSFRGGVRVAAGDVTGDGKADLVTTAGPGGGPIVRVFDPTTLKPVIEYVQGDIGNRFGLSVAAGDLNGDGLAEIITAPASGPVSVATVRRGVDGTFLDVPLFTDQPADATPAATGTLNDLGGARLAVADATADGTSRVILAARGPGFPSKVYRYFIDPIQATDPTQAFEDQFVGGVWVG